MRFNIKTRHYVIWLLILILCVGAWSSVPATLVHASDEVPIVSDSFTTDTNYWDYLGQAQRIDGALQLTPALNDKVGTLWMKQELTPPFTVTFEFQITNPSNAADGLVFMFNKQKNNVPVTGGGLGFETGNGYGVEFDTWRNEWDPSGRHMTLFKNNPDHRIPGTNLFQSETSNIANGSWHSAKIEVTSTSVKAYLDTVLKLNWTGTLDNTYKGIGFAASTGGSNSRHSIDNVVITRPASPDAALKSLIVDGYHIPFHPTTTHYNLTVPHDVSTAHFQYETLDPHASVTQVTSSVTNAVYGVSASGASAQLDVGPNTITITTTAEDGKSLKTYSINITRTGSSNAYLNEISILGTGVLSPTFNSSTYVYNLFVPPSAPTAFVKIALSDPYATYTVTSAAYGNALTNLQEFGITAAPEPIILTLDTSQVGYDIHVLAQDQQSHTTYRINMIQVQPPLADRLGYVRMLDENTIEVAFTEASDMIISTLPDGFQLTGTAAKVSQVIAPITPHSPFNEKVIKLKLNQPVATGEQVMLHLLPGAATLPNNLPLLLMNIPVITLEQLEILSAQLDSLLDGVHIDDVVRFMQAQPLSAKDLNSNGQFDRYDVKLLLLLIK